MLLTMMTTNEQDAKETFLTPDQAGKYFNRDGKTMRRWCMAGHFPNYRRSGPFDKSTYEIPLSDIEALKKQLGHQ
jgi:hypothetical protein